MNIPLTADSTTAFTADATTRRITADMTYLSIPGGALNHRPGAGGQVRPGNTSGTARPRNAG